MKAVLLTKRKRYKEGPEEISSNHYSSSVRKVNEYSRKNYNVKPELIEWVEYNFPEAVNSKNEEGVLFKHLKDFFEEQPNSSKCKFLGLTLGSWGIKLEMIPIVKGELSTRFFMHFTTDFLINNSYKTFLSEFKNKIENFSW